MLQNSNEGQYKLHIARRVFGLVPFVVLLLALILFAGPVGQSPSPYGFAQFILRVVATTLTSCLVCLAAYGFYRYLQDRSYGL